MDGGLAMRWLSKAIGSVLLRRALPVRRGGEGRSAPWVAVVGLMAAAGGVVQAHATLLQSERQEPHLLGVYRFPDDRTVMVWPTTDGPSWRYTDMQTGESHRLYRTDSTSYHSSSDWSSETPVQIRYQFELDGERRALAIVVRQLGGAPLRAARVDLVEIPGVFQSANVELFGKLILPATPGPHPVVVYVHGSDAISSVDRAYFPYMAAANGVAAFVYDKRGTGRSGGGYTQKFQVLADDVLAAVRWLQSRDEVDSARIGLAGFSQGGWVAPLAASVSPAIKFVLVGYGLAMSVADEDRLEAPLKLRALGFGDEAVAQFQLLNSALHEVARRRFAGGWETVESIIAQYQHTPWFSAIQTTDTWAGSFLTMGLDQAKVVAPQLFESFFDPFYDPVPTLEGLNIPMLWLIGDSDIEAPPGPTIATLERLRSTGKPFETVIFPGAGHGMVEFSEHAGGRDIARYAGGFFSTMVAWLRLQTGVE